MSAAEELRRAAEELREKAQAATPGPWDSLGQWLSHGVGTCTCYGGSLPEGHEGGCGMEEIGTLAAPDAKYAATVSPDVGLLLADWLEIEAARADCRDGWTRAPLPEALAIARAINRDQP